MESATEKKIELVPQNCPALNNKTPDLNIETCTDLERMTGNTESAGINRHVVGDARALQEGK